ncbi:hypothetical protein ACEWY4_024986 [Coilia grayii]|uniref:C-type lectin domain-containing protein n=1 Tax=Coilia grayii TaxID=363190 RepID=A0ABD1IWM6_9TELE
MAESEDTGYSENNFAQSGSRMKHKRKKGTPDCSWWRWLALVASVILLAIFIPLRVHFLTNNLEEQRRLCNITSANMTPLQTNPSVTPLQTNPKTACASGWRYFNGKCYFFSTEERSWHQSRDACVTMGGHLVIIETLEEQGFLSQQGSECYWIGLSDDKEGEWRWVDNSLLNDNTKYWNDKEPDDWKGPNDEHPIGEDCASMLINGNIKSWFDGHVCAVIYSKVNIRWGPTPLEGAAPEFNNR